MMPSAEMIDKLDLRVPAMTPLRAPFAEIVKAGRDGNGVGRFTSSAHYQYVIDLQQWGVNAILHAGCKHDRTRAHKLELLETGSKSFPALLEETGSIFDVDPESLAPMRIDLATDVDDVSVSWFRHHARVRFKQYSKQIGKMQMEVSEMGKCEVETLYFGKGRDCIRCYNKTAQLRARYQKKHASLARSFMARGRQIPAILGGEDLEPRRHGSQELPKAATTPSFEELYGIAPDAVLTRVERQIRGKIPAELDRVWKFREHLPNFNPFEQLRLLHIPLSPDLCSLTARDYLMVLGLRSLVLEEGQQRARQQLNIRSKRNASRYFDKYGEFLEGDAADGRGISESELSERYRESLRKQMQW